MIFRGPPQMRKRIYGNPTAEDKRRAAARILAFYRRKNAERSARLRRQGDIYRMNMRARNRAERRNASVIVLD